MLLVHVSIFSRFHDVLNCLFLQGDWNSRLGVLINSDSAECAFVLGSVPVWWYDLFTYDECLLHKQKVILQELKFFIFNAVSKLPFVDPLSIFSNTGFLQKWCDAWQKLSLNSVTSVLWYIYIQEKFHCPVLIGKALYLSQCWNQGIAGLTP